MAITGEEGSQIEVRLYKLPGNGATLAYFDEYAPAAEREILENKVTRYIVPEDTSYGIEITLKAGFLHGKYNGYIDLILHDKASGAKLYDEYIERKQGLSTKTPLEKDKVYHITKIPAAMVDGKPKSNVELALHALLPDEDLISETNIAGDNTNALGGITLKIGRGSEKIVTPKPTKRLEKEMDKYNAQIMARADTIAGATKVDHTLFNKEGLTHGLHLVGGDDLDVLPKPRLWLRGAEHCQTRSYTFLCRTKEYLERSKILKTPIPLDSRPWNCLEELERKSAFKMLQDYDREHTLRQKILQAGVDADEGLLRKQLFEIDEVPSRWRGWFSLLRREREGLFNKLQLRRSFFEKGAYPPDERLPGNSSKTALSLDVEKLENSTPANVDTSFNESTTIKAEPEEDRPPIETAKAKPDVIVLDDSDEELDPPSSKAVVQQVPKKGQTTIKDEPEDLLNRIQQVLPTQTRFNEERPTKRVKIESDAVLPSIETVAELDRLKKEEELEEEELAAAQRVADLIRKRNVRKAKIAALEARSSITSVPSRPGLS